MKQKFTSISKYEIPFRSALFSKTITVTSTTKGAAIRSAMSFDEFAPRRCFGIPRRIQLLHKV